MDSLDLAAVRIGSSVCNPRGKSLPILLICPIALRLILAQMNNTDIPRANTCARKCFLFGGS